MSRYVLINKPELIVDYENERDYKGEVSLKQMPIFAPELRVWFHENFHLIKSISTTLMVESYRYAVALEFYDPKEALVFRLRWL
jgi:hypothetical protein